MLLNKSFQIKENGQITDTIMMVVPSLFGLNPETLTDNMFQPRELSEDEITIRTTALKEFSDMVKQLESEDITIVTCPTPTGSIPTPDAVFPNNWISFHQNSLILYPMKAQNRRAERQLDIVAHTIEKQLGQTLVQNTLDLTYLEKDKAFLEGTGSLVLDRDNHIAFAAISERTSPQALKIFGQQTGYAVVSFHAVDRNDNPIYHTNVVMSVGENFAVVCTDAIKNPLEQQTVITQLTKLNKEIITINRNQLHNFCGNILQVKNKQGQPKIVMSTTAFNAFSPAQLETLHRHGDIISVSIPTIEEIGGGSARCMMAEVFGLISTAV